MKKGIMVKILELLENGIENQTDFFSAILVSGYGASMNKIEYEYQKHRRLSNIRKSQSKDLMAKRERLQKFLSKLKHDGLINETKGENPKFSISNRGKAKLIQLKNKLPNRYYEKINQNRLTIISFDIPEKLRGKRDWLREVIRNLDFKMIHQSVWIGKTKIPKQFILDLGEMNILEYVEIFEINKMGSLKKLK